MNEETPPPDASTDDDEERPSFGEEIDAYLEAVDEGELGAAWWETDRVVGVSFTGRVDEHREALESLLGRRNVVVREAEYSGVELRALHKQIMNAMFSEPGGLVTLVASDEEAGHVTVGVLTLDDDARAYVRRRWPHPAVIVIQAGPFTAA